MALRLHATSHHLSLRSSSSLKENAASPKSLTHSHHLSPTAGWICAGAGLGQELRSLGELALLRVLPLTALLQLLLAASPLDSKIRNMSPSRRSSCLKVMLFGLQVQEAGMELPGSQQWRCCCFPCSDAQHP